MSRIIFFILSFILAASTAFAQAPEWALTHKHPRFPLAEYIVGVGSATGLKADEAAKKLAQSDIASQVRVRVQTEVRNVQSTYELNRSEESYAQFRIQSTSVVDEQLPGAEIVETTTDPASGTTYALAALSRAKYAQALEADLHSGWGQVDELKKNAGTFLRDGKFTEAIQNLLDARSQSIALLPKIALHDAVAGKAYGAQATLGPSALTSAIRAAVASLHIAKLKGDNQQGRIGELFPAPFGVSVMLAARGHDVPARGVPIAFRGMRGSPVVQVPTDRNGVAEARLTATGTLGGSITAGVVLPSGAKEFEANATSSSVTFRCSMDLPDVAFTLRSESVPPRFSRPLVNKVKTAISGIGYGIVDISRYALVVQLETLPASSVSGLSGSLYSISGTVTISLRDKQLNTTLGDLPVKIKGMGASGAEAVEKGIAAMSIENDALLALLSRAH